MSGLTDKEILANRHKWADFLINGNLQKGVNILEEINSESRCCLGHGCFILGINRKEKGIDISYDGEYSVAPLSFVDLVGLKDNEGSFEDFVWFFDYRDGVRKFLKYNPNPDKHSKFDGTEFDSLIKLNDDTDATPKEIGEFLKMVIMGGDHSPFKELLYV